MRTERAVDLGAIFNFQFSIFGKFGESIDRNRSMNLLINRAISFIGFLLWFSKGVGHFGNIFEIPQELSFEVRTKQNQIRFQQRRLYNSPIEFKH